MGLESATYISQLNANNPIGGVDEYSTADDHLRLVKSVLLATLPNANAAINPTPTEFNYLVGVTSAVQTQLGARELLANKNANNGYAGLNASAQLLDARVQQSNVTQHQAALALATSQITTGTFADARIASSNVTQHQGALSIATSQLTGNMPDARIVLSNITQHQASLTIVETQIIDGSLLARNAGTETISGAWTYSTRPKHTSAGGYLSNALAANSSGVVEISATVPGAVFGNPGDIRLVY
jgi:hypothetical protein